MLKRVHTSSTDGPSLAATHGSNASSRCIRSPAEVMSAAHDRSAARPPGSRTMGYLGAPPEQKRSLRRDRLEPRHDLGPQRFGFKHLGVLEEPEHERTETVDVGHDELDHDRPVV